MKLKDLPSSNFIIFIDDNNIVITKPKGGTRFVNLYFRNDQSFEISLKDTIFNVEMGDSFSKDIQDWVKNEWRDVLENKSNKNIIFVYREPFKRFISGLIQDTNDYILSNEEYNELHHILTSFSEIDNINEGDLDKINEQWGNILKNDFLSKYHHYNSNGNYSVHTTPFLGVFQEILETIDGYILYNLDGREDKNELDEMFKEYLKRGKLFKPRGNMSNKYFKQITESILDSHPHKCDFLWKEDEKYYNWLVTNPNNWKKF